MPRATKATKQAPAAPPPSNALQLTRTFCERLGLDAGKPVGQDVLALVVRMSEADRDRLAAVLRAAG